MDIAGIDVLEHVTQDLAKRLADDSARQAFTLPPLVHALVERGWIGEKAKQGFYKREGDQILTLDPASLTYRQKQPAQLPSRGRDVDRRR
jgi:3-hydroxyacyl-CoA dehydrogenase